MPRQSSRTRLRFVVNVSSLIWIIFTGRARHGALERVEHVGDATARGSRGPSSSRRRRRCSARGSRARSSRCACRTSRAARRASRGPRWRRARARARCGRRRGRPCRRCPAWAARLRGGRRARGRCARSRRCATVSIVRVVREHLARERRGVRAADDDVGARVHALDLAARRGRRRGGSRSSRTGRRARRRARATTSSTRRHAKRREVHDLHLVPRAQRLRAEGEEAVRRLVEVGVEVALRVLGGRALAADVGRLARHRDLPGGRVQQGDAHRSDVRYCSGGDGAQGNAALKRWPSASVEEGKRAPAGPSDWAWMAGLLPPPRVARCSRWAADVDGTAGARDKGLAGRRGRAGAVLAQGDFGGEAGGRRDVLAARASRGFRRGCGEAARDGLADRRRSAARRADARLPAGRSRAPARAACCRWSIGLPEAFDEALATGIDAPAARAGPKGTALEFASIDARPDEAGALVSVRSRKARGLR